MQLAADPSTLVGQSTEKNISGVLLVAKVFQKRLAPLRLFAWLPQAWLCFLSTGALPPKGCFGKLVPPLP